MLPSEDQDQEDVFLEARGSVDLEEEIENDEPPQEKEAAISLGGQSVNNQSHRDEQTIMDGEIDGIIHNIALLKEEPINGFGPSSQSSDVKQLKEILATYTKESNERMDKMEFAGLANSVRLSKVETNIKKLSQDVIAISTRVHHNAEGLVRTESRVLGVEKSVRTSTIAVEQRIAKLEQSIKAGKIGINIRAVAEKVSQEVSEILTTNIGTADINELKQELKVLKTDIRADQNLTEGLREIVIELKDKVLNISSSSQRMIPTRSNAYATSNAAGLAEIMN